MGSIVVHPTDLSQWYSLVNEAELKCRCQVSEDLESYLVFLLMRFSQQAQLASSVIGLDWLHSINAFGPQRHERLRDVGDKSLLFCGLFPGIATKRRVHLDYFVTMGQTAYGYLADLESSHVASFYASLCQRFVNLKNILQAMRVLDEAYIISVPQLENGVLPSH